MLYPNKVAVLGAGLTRFMRRAVETPKAALEDAGLTIQDIDCVVCATAPDAFDGVHMNGEYLADLTIEQIMASEVMAWPVQRLMVSPISDGAVGTG